MNPDDARKSRELVAEAHKLGFIGNTTLDSCQDFFQLQGSANVNLEQFFLKLANLNKIQLAVIQKDWSVLDRLEAFNDKLRILGEISRGGMGVVYQAWDSVLDRIVAIKEVLPSKLTSKSRGIILRRFELEAKTMASIQHPAVVGIYDAGLSPRGTPFMVIDYVPGNSLSQVIHMLNEGWTLEQALKPSRMNAGGIKLDPSNERVFLEVEQVVRWGKDLAEGLQACHDRGVLHRDIKPANVLVSERAEVKLTDFGVALDTYTERMTKTGQGVGTPLYMAPENLFGKRKGENTSPTSDIYSLGATLFEALTGCTPYSAESARELYVKVYGGKPTPVRELRPDVPVPLETIIMKCLAREPEERYPTAKELGEDLARFLLGAEVLAAPSGDEAVSPPGVRHKVLIAAVALAAVALVVALVLAALVAVKGFE